MTRPIATLLVAAVLVGGVAAGCGALNLPFGPAATGAPGVASGVSPAPQTGGTSVPGTSPSSEPTGSATPGLTPDATPTAEPTPTPKPTPKVVPAPLTGMPVSEAVAKRPVIAVMIDDQLLARPQSGLSQASIVWQAPAEGGIPRYMALFQDTNPTSVGPVRSSRLYFIAWASEWRSVYVHVGGSPQALALLRSPQGRGKVVYDADEMRYGGKYLYRIKARYAPHNVYSDAKKIRALAKVVGAKPMNYKAVWQFAPDAPLAERPQGSKLTIPYLANRVSYAYNRGTNTWLRTVSVEGKQVDPATKTRIAPKNVVIMFVSFAPLKDGSKKHRLEAQFIGKGAAWIATNGKTVKGTWRKASMTAPTKLFLADGTPVTLTMGQTFVQVVPLGTKITIVNGKVPPPAAGTTPSPSPSPSSTP
jgi:hypothetical protein